ncbi:MAG TPA: ornithine carbamoyltransferase [Candidatus Omnitrophota bacterium]|nr:ornithine carbamoyltransferase [Candidatus Omnitrophota bacterium]
MKKDFLALQDFSKEELLYLLELTEKLKKKKIKNPQVLKGKSIGLVFQKSSNRTRVSFEVGIHQLGGNCIYLGPKEIKLGVREAVSDVGKTLERYLNGVVARTYSHQYVVDLAKYTRIPIINGLSDLTHPCQALTDIFSIKEKFGTLKNITVAYVGDGNNVCNSLLIGCSKLGIDMNIATPQGYEVIAPIIENAKTNAKKSGAKLIFTQSPQEAVKNAHVIYTDTWVSMGQETESEKRLNDFKDFQVNQELTRLAKKDFIFMHCLPAHRGQEVTDDIMDGKNSIIFDQAENRLHTQKAIMTFLFKG